MSVDGASDWPEPYQAFSADGHSARWTRWDEPGHDWVNADPANSDPVDTDTVDIDAVDRVDGETFTISWENEAWTAVGNVSREAVQYVVRISPTWHVRQFLLFRDMDEPDLWLGTDGNGRWGEMNGDHRPDLDGCIDIDLGCTPFTNTLPIRRLPLHVGHTADIMVAHVDVETLEVRPDRQRYTRVGSHRWRFEQRDTGFSQEFDVDSHGLVMDYPTLFRRIA